MIEKKSIAALLHVIRWEYDEDVYELSPNIYLCKTPNSNVGKLYKEMCKKDGLDYGEPFVYNSHILIDNCESSIWLEELGNPYALFDRVANIIVINISEPIGMCRIINSIDDYTECYHTALVYKYGEQTDFLQTHSSRTFNSNTLTNIQSNWLIANGFWEKELSNGRLNSALTYFYYSWRAPYIDQTCINLAIAMEILFSPSTQSEISHQISYNISRFMSESTAEREVIFTNIKKFYSVRSQIIHGSVPDDMKIIDITVYMFHLIAHILQKILSSIELADTFNENKSRIQYLKKYLFV